MWEISSPTFFGVHQTVGLHLRSLKMKWNLRLFFVYRHSLGLGGNNTA